MNGLYVDLLRFICTFVFGVFVSPVTSVAENKTKVDRDIDSTTEAALHSNF